MIGDEQRDSQAIATILAFELTARRGAQSVEELMAAINENRHFLDGVAGAEIAMPSRTRADDVDERLWRVTRYVLHRFAHFNDEARSFSLPFNPFIGERLFNTWFNLGKAGPETHPFRIDHPVAQRVLNDAKIERGCYDKVTFRGSPTNSDCDLRRLAGKRGWMQCTELTIEYIDTRDVLAFVGMSDDGDVLTSAECRAMLDCRANGHRHFSMPCKIRQTLSKWTNEIKETQVNACQVLSRECLEKKRLELIQSEMSPLALDHVKRRAAEAKLAIHQYKAVYGLTDEVADRELKRLEDELDEAHSKCSIDVDIEEGVEVVIWSLPQFGRATCTDEILVATIEWTME